MHLVRIRFCLFEKFNNLMPSYEHLSSYTFNVKIIYFLNSPASISRRLLEKNKLANSALILYTALMAIWEKLFDIFPNPPRWWKFARIVTKFVTMYICYLNYIHIQFPSIFRKKTCFLAFESLSKMFVWDDLFRKRGSRCDVRGKSRIFFIIFYFPPHL